MLDSNPTNTHISPMITKFAEELSSRRIGFNRALDLNAANERANAQGGGDVLKKLRVMAEIATAKREAAQSFDKEANEKDLVGRNRRGVEAAVEYDLRRKVGIPPKNERDDPRSPYSREGIEDGLMARESDNGVEYGAFWDKDGELIAIYKGDKGSVGAHIEGDKVKGGMMTHSHPTEFNSDGTPKRPFGYAFSAGDVNVHAVRELGETRAVAREGTYSFSTEGAKVEIPKSILSQLPPSIQSDYASKTGEARQTLALKVLSLCSKEGSPYNPIDRAVREVAYDVAKTTSLPQDSPRVLNKVLGSKDFLVRQAVYQRKLFEEFGVKWEFKAANGFEDVGRAIAARNDQGGMSDHFITSAFDASVPRRPADKPSIIGSDGKRSDLVLRSYRDGDQPRTAPPPKSAPKVITAKRVVSAPKTPADPKPKEAEPIKPAPPVARPIDPPRDILGDFFKNVERRQRGGGLGGLRKVELPRDVFGD